MKMRVAFCELDIRFHALCEALSLAYAMNDWAKAWEYQRAMTVHVK